MAPVTTDFCATTSDHFLVLCVQGFMAPYKSYQLPKNPPNRRRLDMSTVSMSSPPGKASERPRHSRPAAPYMWSCGQTKLGIAEIIPPGQDAGAGARGLTVVEMGDLVRKFEEEKQDDLRRLAGLLEWMRHSARAHGAPCVAVFHLGASERDREPGDHSIQIHSSGPEEVPVLLDWHEEHFWSKKGVHQEHVGPQERTIDAESRPRKGAIRQLARWLGL
ncbi:hypothetical protein INS49_015777 [Diaporthe citri]|uniref:uncharacterized protein n=1 Tax=Diaporthe citri TaxID=83186 RepID=UPI001C815DBB|nr:uncharacterized protein INS49_015777 [Diaporthe citri]KAG6356389.1 hypothetical protein INS49_015777 [Diaporthe citri]